MAELTPTALRVVLQQHGVITTNQLRRAGVGHRTQLRLEERGLLTRRYKSVLQLAGAQQTMEMRCAALCLAHQSVFVTGATGGKLAGLRTMPRVAPLTVSSAHPLHIEHGGVLLRRTTKLLASDVQSRDDGIRIASPVRLAFDLAATLSDRAHRSVIEQMLHESMVTLEELAQIATRLAHPCRPGSKRFLNTLLTRSGAALESDPEITVAEALWARDVPVVAQEVWLDLPNGGHARIDLSVASLKWGVEVDVHPDHLGINGTSSDKQRDRQCHLIGWQIERVTTLDLLNLDATAQELADLYRQRRRNVA